MATQSTSDAIPVLLTRPEPEGRAFAALLSRHFGPRLRPVIAPLLAVEYLSPKLPIGPFAGVIFTSSTGVAAARRLGVVLPDHAWCVGENTAERARAEGFVAQAAGGDAAALIDVIIKARPGGTLLHLHGLHTRGEVAERLASAGISTCSVVVYRQVAQPLTPSAVELLARPGVLIVPLFSPRTAALLAEAMPAEPRADLRLICMSAAVAEAAPKGRVILAARPDAAAMAEAVGRALA